MASMHVFSSSSFENVPLNHQESVKDNLKVYEKYNKAYKESGNWISRLFNRVKLAFVHKKQNAQFKQLFKAKIVNAQNDEKKLKLGIIKNVLNKHKNIDKEIGKKENFWSSSVNNFNHTLDLELDKQKERAYLRLKSRVQHSGLDKTTRQALLHVNPNATGKQKLEALLNALNTDHSNLTEQQQRKLKSILDSHDFKKARFLQNIDRDQIQSDFYEMMDQVIKINIYTLSEKFSDLTPEVLDKADQIVFNKLLEALDQDPSAIKYLDRTEQHALFPLAAGQPGGLYPIFLELFKDRKPPMPQMHAEAYLAVFKLSAPLGPYVDHAINEFIVEERDSKMVENILRDPAGNPLFQESLNRVFVNAIDQEIENKKNDPKTGIDPEMGNLLKENANSILLGHFAEQAMAKYHLSADYVLNLIPKEQQPDFLVKRLRAYEVAHPPQNSYNLTDDEIKGLQILTTIRAGDAEDLDAYMEENKQELEIFFEKAVADDSFNKKLRSIDESDVIPFGISEKAIQMMTAYTFKTRTPTGDWGHLGHIAAKAQELSEKLKTNKPISSKEKLTLQELGTLSNLASLRPVLEKLKDKEIQVSTVEGLRILAEKAETSLKEINTVLEEELKGYLRPGDTLAHDGRREFTFKNRKVVGEQKLNLMLVSKYLHLAKIARDPDPENNNRIMLSHVMGGRIFKPIGGVGELAYSDLYRFDVGKYAEKKLPKWTIEILKERFKGHEGGWKAALQERYEYAHQKFHTNTNELFEQYENKKSQRMSAGKAGFIPMGHKQMDQIDFKKIYHTVLTEGKLPEDLDKDDEQLSIICSEFDMVSDIVAMYDVNDFIGIQVADFLRSTEAPPNHRVIKKYRADAKFSKMIDDKLSNRSEHPLLPQFVPRHENLKKVHPGRNIRLKERTGALRAIPPPVTVQKVVAFK